MCANSYCFGSSFALFMFFFWVPKFKFPIFSLANKFNFHLGQILEVFRAVTVNIFSPLSWSSLKFTEWF